MANFYLMHIMMNYIRGNACGTPPPPPTTSSMDLEAHVTIILREGNES